MDAQAITGDAPGVRAMPSQAARFGVEVRTDGGDPLAIDENVGPARALRGDDRAIADQRAHRSSSVVAPVMVPTGPWLKWG